MAYLTCIVESKSFFISYSKTIFFLTGCDILLFLVCQTSCLLFSWSAACPPPPPFLVGNNQTQVLHKQQNLNRS